MIDIVGIYVMVEGDSEDNPLKVTVTTENPTENEYHNASIRMVRRHLRAELAFLQEMERDRIGGDTGLEDSLNENPFQIVITANLIQDKLEIGTCMSSLLENFLQRWYTMQDKEDNTFLCYISLEWEGLEINLKGPSDTARSHVFARIRPVPGENADDITLALLRTNPDLNSLL